MKVLMVAEVWWLWIEGGRRQRRPQVWDPSFDTILQHQGEKERERERERRDYFIKC